MKCYYSIIPSFHYSCLEYVEWLTGDSLLSTICRISDTFNYYREHQALHKSRQVGEWVLSKKKSDFYSEHDTLLKHSLEATLHLLKEHPQQDKHLQQVLQIHRLAYGRKDPRVAVDLKNLGLVYLKTGQKEKARNYMEKAYNILIQTFGTEHPETRKVKEALHRLF